MGARRGAELLSHRDLSHEAPGTAEHSETLTRIMKSQEDADVKAGVAAADPHVAARSLCVAANECVCKSTRLFFFLAANGAGHTAIQRTTRPKSCTPPDLGLSSRSTVEEPQSTDYEKQSSHM